MLSNNTHSISSRISKSGGEDRSGGVPASDTRGKWGSVSSNDKVLSGHCHSNHYENNL